MYTGERRNPNEIEPFENGSTPSSASPVFEFDLDFELDSAESFVRGLEADERCSSSSGNMLLRMSCDRRGVAPPVPVYV